MIMSTPVLVMLEATSLVLEATSANELRAEYEGRFFQNDNERVGDEQFKLHFENITSAAGCRRFEVSSLEKIKAR